MFITAIPINEVNAIDKTIISNILFSPVSGDLSIGLAGATTLSVYIAVSDISPSITVPSSNTSSVPLITNLTNSFPSTFLIAESSAKSAKVFPIF